MTTIYLSAASGSWTVPSDCRKIDSVDCFGGGGSGAAQAWATVNVSGGGGGAFSRKLNIPVTPGQVINYVCGAGGAPVSISAAGSWAGGNPGGDTYFGGYYCYAQGGRGGNVASVPSTAPGGAGGAASAGVGDVRYDGGRGGDAIGSGGISSGGGGCAGPNGAGVNGLDNSSGNSAGGYGDAYAGGAGSAGVGYGSINAHETSGPGGTGTELGSGYGCGGGSGSARVSGSPGYVATTGAGGQFGGGSGSAVGQSSGNAGVSGWGYQGFIVITYTPYVIQIPTVTALSKQIGKQAGGETITITGTNFNKGLASVKFGSVNAASYTYVSPTSITCVTPAQPAGTVVNVIVTNVDGTSAPTSANQFTYIAPNAGIFNMPMMGL